MDISSYVVDVVNKRCRCGKAHPCFGMEGGLPKDARWCAQCKPPDAVDVVSKRCHCGKAIPCFGMEGDRRKDARWCAQCKPPDAVDVVNKRCHCDKAKPRFGMKGDRPKDARWCAKCKPPGAVDVVSKRCHCGKAHACFAMDGDRPKDARWCAQCKPPDAVDVVNKRCHCGKAHARFGMEGDCRKDARWCAQCKPPDAVNVASKRCHCGKAIPCFGMEGDRPKDARWCSQCKPPDAVNVVSKRCLTEHCDTQVNPHLEGYCMACFRFKYPEHPRVRYARSEELAVLADVYRRFSAEDWAQRMVSDRRIDGGCSQRRPDIFVDLLTHVLIVEVDEHQHREYETSCENKRIMELFRDAGSRPLVVLRFNPHAYTDAAGARVRSPWTRDPKTQEPRVPTGRAAEWTARLDALASRIEYWTRLREIPEREVQTEWIFYDHCA